MLYNIFFIILRCRDKFAVIYLFEIFILYLMICLEQVLLLFEYFFRIFISPLSYLS